MSEHHVNHVQGVLEGLAAAAGVHGRDAESLTERVASQMEGRIQTQGRNNECTIIDGYEQLQEVELMTFGSTMAWVDESRCDTSYTDQKWVCCVVFGVVGCGVMDRGLWFVT